MGRALLFFVAILPAASGVLRACSGVTVVSGGKVLLGHNNDYRYAAEMLLRIVPPGDGLFGRVCISMETVPGWTPMGMTCINDQGLAITHANVPKAATPYDPDKPQFRHNFLEKIVAESTTVKQAVAMVKAYSLPAEHGAFVHLMLADAGGDSAVIEWVDGEVKVIPRQGSTQLMTNFLLSKPETAGGPQSRYARGVRMLEQLKEPSVPALVAVLKEISVHGRHQGEEVGTLESVVFDVTGGKVYLYSKRDFDHPLVLDMNEVFAKGARTESYNSLFPHPVAFETGNRYEDGPPAQTAGN